MAKVNQFFGQARAVTPDVEQTRKITFVLSTSTRDRHRTVLNQENWLLDNYNNNPIVGYQHNVYGDPCREPNPDDILGSARVWIEDGQLLGEATFETKDVNPLAEKIFRKLLNRTLRAVSVGFVPVGEGRFGEGEEAEGMPNQTYYFAGQELLEFSVVNLPSNPEAVKRSFRDQTSNAILFIKKELGSEYSFSDIEDMKVRDILDILENPDKTKTKKMSKTKDKTSIAKRIMEVLGIEDEKRMIVTAADGTEIDIDKAEGNPEVGDAANVDGKPATGEYVMPDGSTIVCVDGKITEIKPKAEAAPEAEKAPEEKDSAIEKENQRLLAENKILTDTVADQAAEIKENTKSLEAIEKRLEEIKGDFKPGARSTQFNNGKKKDEAVNKVEEAKARRTEYKKK